MVTDSRGMGTDAESISITMDDILAVQNSHVEIKRWRQVVVVADHIVIDIVVLVRHLRDMNVLVFGLYCSRSGVYLRRVPSPTH